MQFGCLIETRVKEKRAGKIISGSFSRLGQYIKLRAPQIGKIMGCLGANGEIDSSV